MVSKKLEVVWDVVSRYGGLRALGAIMSSRKGIYGAIAIAAGYYLCLGRLPADADPEVLTRMGEVFGLLLGVIAGLFIGGTALEDALAKGAKNAGSPSTVPYAELVGKTYTKYLEDGSVDISATLSEAITIANQQQAKKLTDKPENSEG